MKHCVKSVVVVIAIGLIAAASVSAQGNTKTERHRGFMFEGELGIAYTSYDAATDAAFAQAEALGVSRIRVSLGLMLGYAVSRDVYVVGGLEGYGDRFYDSYNYIQLNTFFWVLGLRYYPFGRGLVLGIQGGVATAGIMSDIGVTGSSTSPGYGGGVLAAYDFTGGLTGFGVEVGGRADYALINSSPMKGASVFVALVWK